MDISSMLSNENDDSHALDKRSILRDAIDSANLNRVTNLARPSVTRKRKSVQRFETCMQCTEEYDTTNNPKDACVWHSGRTEPDFDGDFWADHDENCHGIIDSDFCREEYPEGFRWSCCDKLGDQEGCMIDVHRPQTAKKVKTMAHNLEHSPDRIRHLLPRATGDMPAQPNGESQANSAPVSQRECIQCEQLFDVTSNTKVSCVWHTGDLEVIEDSDVWADHDEACHGPMNTEANQQDFPDAFYWDCCDRGGDQPGCEVDVHRSEICSEG
ncbi:hypothetical protein DE146DRAFT_739771 [Phaeosphaeria sp. MPI-PUGE-AT-0046c]|nr:hypothetical protein DE146DRAFT_739771 [Phaeosphaeria sp. MPI-PUGE-AT-0046c]